MQELGWSQHQARTSRMRDLQFALGSAPSAPAVHFAPAAQPVQHTSETHQLVAELANKYDMSPEEYVAYQKMLGGPDRPRPVLKSRYEPPTIDVRAVIKRGTDELNRIVDTVISHAERKSETLRLHASMTQDAKNFDVFTDHERLSVLNLMDIDMTEIEACRDWARDVSNQLLRVIEVRRSVNDQKAFAYSPAMRDAFDSTTYQLGMIQDRLLTFVDTLPKERM